MEHSKNKQNEEQLSNHPIFKNKKIRSDAEVKKMFQSTFSIYKSIVQEMLSDELECCDEGDIYEESRDQNRLEEKNCHKACEEKDASNYEEDFGEEDSAEEIAEDMSLDVSTEYAVIFTVVRLYKIFEHLLLRKYLSEKKLSSVMSISDIEFEDIIAFFKKNRVISSSGEENSIYFLQLFVHAVEENFLFQYSKNFEESLLTNDEYMFSDIDHGTMYQTVANLSTIVGKL